MKKSLIAVLAMLAIMSTGCAYKSIKHGREIGQQEASEIIIGGTTKRQIFLDFGEPSKTADDEQVFFYTWTRGKKFAVLGIGSGGAEANTLVVVFDDNDVVEDYRITRGAVASGQVD